MMYRTNAFVPRTPTPVPVASLWTRLKCRFGAHEAEAFNWAQDHWFGPIHIKFFCKHCDTRVIWDLTDHKRNIAALHCGKGITW